MTHLRRATKDDIDSFKKVIRMSILELCKDFYSDEEISSLCAQYPAKGIYESWLGDRVMIVAEDANEIVGFAQFNPINSSIEALHVLPEYNNQGIGKALVKQIEEFAKNIGIQKITLGSSLNAQSFYEKCGYVRKDASKYQCKNGMGLDVVNYEKEISSQ